MSDSTISTISKNKNKNDRSCQKIHFIEGNKTNKNSRRACMSHTETSNDRDWRLDTEACLFKLHDDHSQSKKIVERRGWT